MKKTAAILLVITLFTSLFHNVVECYLLSAYKKEQSWIQAMQNTPNSEFKVIKLNATLYSFIEDSDIEKVNENFILDNKVYHIFKKSIKDNVINLYYLGDKTQNTIDINLKKMVDSQSNSDQSPIEKIIKSFSKYYLISQNKINFFSINFRLNKTPIFAIFNPKILSGFLSQQSPPPQMV